MRTRTVTMLAILLGTSGLPAYWVLAGEDREGRPNSTIAEIEVKLAEARCELARQHLARCLAHPKSSLLTAVTEEAVESFESELADLKAGKKRDSFNHLLDEIKHLSRIAARRIELLESTDAKTRGTIDASELAMLRAKHEVLRLGAVHGELLRSASPQVKIDWQLEQLWSIQLLFADQLFEQGM